MKTTTHSLEEMHALAADFVKSIVSKKEMDCATVVGLSGDLGAGKTSFTQGVAKAFFIDETVVSPTFVIMKKYNLTPQGLSLGKEFDAFTHLIHIDAYRLEKSSELVHLGWQEIISDPKNLVLIEWSERVIDIIPAYYIKINFEHVSQNERTVEINM